MHRSPLVDLRQIEGEDPDPGLVSASLVKLIYASSHFEAKIYDSDPRSGTYVVVLEGVLDISEREDAPADEPSSGRTVPVVPGAAEGAAEPAAAPLRRESTAMGPFGGGGEPGTGG